MELSRTIVKICDDNRVYIGYPAGPFYESASPFDSDGDHSQIACALSAGQTPTVRNVRVVERLSPDAIVVATYMPGRLDTRWPRLYPDYVKLESLRG